MKKIITALLLTSFLSQPVQAKSAYSEMKDDLRNSVKSTTKHYNGFKVTGSVVRFIPNIFYAQDMAVGVVMLVGGGIELIQAPMPKRDCSLKDFFADWKGLRDGLNGKDFIRDELMLKALRDSNQSILDQKEVLELLQERVELLESAQLQVKGEIK